MACNFEGHIVFCGWNARGPRLLSQLLASGRQAAVVAESLPDGLPAGVPFVRGNPSRRESLLEAGLTRAKEAIILGGSEDSQAILTGLAVEAIAPEVYSVMELHDPQNECYARYAHVDDILYADSLIADITGICTHYEGLSSFIKDILSTSDDGHSFASFDVPAEFEGRTVGELFAHFSAQGLLPVGLIIPPEDKAKAPVSQWQSCVDPALDAAVTLPVKAVCIRKNKTAKG
ncbi:MAG: NAD-binding protein [Fretibacterium sp.]|nr:NAD-binding protein [Fretibacterium sp.]